MTFRELTSAEQQLIGRCLFEAANGKYFPDWEFETLIGADRSAVRKTASQWLSGDSISDDSKALSLSVLNNLLGYPHNSASELQLAVGAELGEVRRVFSSLERVT